MPGRRSASGTCLSRRGICTNGNARSKTRTASASKAVLACNLISSTASSRTQFAGRKGHGHRQQPARPRDFLARQLVRIARAIHALMMHADEHSNLVPCRWPNADNSWPNDRMLLDERAFRRRSTRGGFSCQRRMSDRGTPTSPMSCSNAALSSARRSSRGQVSTCAIAWQSCATWRLWLPSGG